MQQLLLLADFFHLMLPAFVADVCGRGQHLACFEEIWQETSNAARNIAPFGASLKKISDHVEVVVSTSNSKRRVRTLYCIEYIFVRVLRGSCISIESKLSRLESSTFNSEISRVACMGKLSSFAIT